MVIFQELEVGVVVLVIPQFGSPVSATRVYVEE
jgi:hypothetical protein